MKNNKFEQSQLTARERKELRRTNGEGAAEEEAVETNPDRLKLRNILMIILLIVACGLIFAGIYIPYYYTSNYLGCEHPVAVIEFQIGDETEKIEYDVRTDICPNASANFIYLASIGYFDGVIIYDNANDWVKFGGYTDLEYNHRTDDQEFVAGVAGDFADERNADPENTEIFKYAVKSDSSSSELSYESTLYCLTANVSSSTYNLGSTQFQFNTTKEENNDNFTVPYKSSSKLSYGTSSSYEGCIEAFATPRDYVAAGKVLKKIAAIEDTYDKTESFDTPLVDGKAVIIKSVKIYNYTAEWERVEYEHSFEDYMTEIGGFVSDASWTKEYVKPTIETEEAEEE